jgi:hypothetical protein
MKADDFSVWFSGVGRRSAEQRLGVAAFGESGWRASAGGRDGDLRGRRGDGQRREAGSSSRCFGSERP